MTTATNLPSSGANDAASVWHAIKTAPKDGTLVRLRAPKYGTVRGLWSWDGERWVTRIVGVMGMVPAVWDEHAQQPTEWADFNADIP